MMTAFRVRSKILLVRIWFLSNLEQKSSFPSSPIKSHEQNSMKMKNPNTDNFQYPVIEHVMNWEKHYFQIGFTIRPNQYNRAILDIPDLISDM